MKCQEQSIAKYWHSIEMMLLDKTEEEFNISWAVLLITSLEEQVKEYNMRMAVNMNKDIQISSLTYIEWLNKQRNREGSIGDLVRKFLTDKNIKSWYGFRDHLKELGTTEDEMKTCEKSWVEYTKYRKWK